MLNHKVKATVAATLLSFVLLGSMPATAGPLTAALTTKAVAEICGPATIATGPWGLACFGFGAILAIVTVPMPSP